MASRSILGLILAIAISGCAAEEGAEPDPVPAALHNIEGTAESAFDHAMVGDLSGVSTDATALDSDWSSFRPTALKDGVSEADALAVDEAIAALKAAAEASSDNLELARAANAVSAPMDSLFAVYNPPTPPALMELDYLGREVLLDGSEVDFTRAAQDVQSTDATWKSIRQTVVDAGGSKEATQFDDAVNAMRSASEAQDGPGLVASSNEELELVDLIESVFARSADPPD